MDKKTLDKLKKLQRKKQRTKQKIERAKRRKVHIKSRPKAKPKPKQITYAQAKALYNTPQYKRWRTIVFKRDQFTCQMCGQNGGRLEAHHIRPKRTNPELVLSIKNGITLCYFCHQKVVTGIEERFIFIFEKLLELKACTLQ